MANRNIVYAEIFVDELARSGLKAVCAAPGSRHTPLMLAFAKHPDIRVYSHLDERSASFFALGLALASDSPVALICTSGTAGANMYPAIIEAHQSRVPLIVITADRPPELRHSGANQTIDQIKMFGDFVLWFVDAALPEANPPAVAIRNLRTTANRAFATANGLRKGVVHINMPFRKPLEPTPVEGDVTNFADARQSKRNLKLPYTEFGTRHQSAYERITLWDGFEILGDWNDKGKLLVIAGPRLSFNEAESILQFTNLMGGVLLTDCVSNLRFMGINTITAYDTFLANSDIIPKPDWIIRLGDVPTSKNLNRLLAEFGDVPFTLIAEHGQWSDDIHQVSQFIHGSPAQALYDLSLGSKNTGERYWQKLFRQIEKTTWQTIDHEMENGAYFDGGVVYDLVDLIPPESTLFAGNSLPVRLLDQFGKPQDKRIYTYANRGTSGIDGNISTALGAGAARPDKPLVAVMGDITFYHDMNGLLAVHRCGVPITIVLLNNDGGGIFHRLPIKDYDPEFTDYFLTPHGLDFSHAATMYGLDHVLIDVSAPDARQQFREAFSASVAGQGSTIIEVRTDARADLRRRDEIVAAVHDSLADNHKDAKDTKGD